LGYCIGYSGVAAFFFEESKMTEFNKLRAEQEILLAMNEARSVMMQMERELNETYSLTETRLNNIRKIIGAFDGLLIAPQREKVDRLQREAELK
jgi:hypothetical protein